jgi:hypothetical protein
MDYHRSGNRLFSCEKVMGGASAAFENLVLAGKGGLIAFLLALAIVNAHTEYVEKNPRKFIIDAVATGGFGALAAVWLTATRGRLDLWVNHLIFALMLFFLYHVCREFAGYFTIFGNEKMTAAEMKEKKALKWPILSIGIVAALAAVVLAGMARVVPDFSEGIFKGFSGWKIPFAIETFVFALIISMGEVVVTKNHGDPLAPAFTTSMFLFVLAACVLQAGGFYEHLYTAPPPCIQ